MDEPERCARIEQPDGRKVTLKGRAFVDTKAKNTRGAASTSKTHKKGNLGRPKSEKREKGQPRKRWSKGNP